MVWFEKYDNMDKNMTFLGGKQRSSVEAAVCFSLFTTKLFSVTKQVFLTTND